MVQLASHERRRFPRALASGAVEYQSVLGLESSLVSDVGGGGMLVDGRTALAVGSELWLRFNPPGTPRPVFVHGTVLRLGVPTENPGEHRGFAIEFVDLTGGLIEEIDWLVRRHLAPVLGVRPEDVPPRRTPQRIERDDDEPRSAGPLRVTFRSEREFVDAYTSQLFASRIHLDVSDPLPVGARLEVQLELPNYYDPVRLECEVVGEAPGAGEGGGSGHIARILDSSHEALRFVHDFASVFLGAPQVTAAANGAVRAPMLETQKIENVAERIARDTAAAKAQELAALLAAERAAAVAPGAAEASAAPEARDSTLHDTHKIENIAELVAQSIAAMSRREPGPRVSGKTAAEWILTLGDDDPDQRMAAASALGKLGAAARAGVTALCTALGDVDPRVRRAAAWALGDVGRDASHAVPALIDVLSDSDARVRWRAVRALRHIGPASALAVPELTRALLDDDDRVRQWAEAALADLENIGADAVLSTSSV